MGITERRERERLGMRRLILDAARDLFARYGYEKVTMRAIAEAIEYSPTTIYNHFEDKDDLVLSLCREDFGRLLEALAQGGPPEDPVEWIRSLGRGYARFGLTHPNHYRFMFMTPAKPSHAHEATEPGFQSFEVLRRAVGRAIEAGRFRPGDVTESARVLWANVHGAVSLLITLNPDHWPAGPPDVDALIEAVLDAGIRGLLAPGEA